MKKILTNIFATTGLSLLLLSAIALCYDAECLYITSVFQTLEANVVIHIGLLFVQKMELKYTMLEGVLEIGIIIGVLIGFGAIFQWFSSTPVWVLIIMGIVIYIVSWALNLLHMKQEAQEINELIKKRNRKTEFVKV